MDKNTNTAKLIVLGLFAVVLTMSIILDISLIIALLVGYAIFFIYSLVIGLSIKDFFKESLGGIFTIKTILITFILIGAVTGLWRACGTIPAIVDYSAALITPSLMILLTFLLNALVSTLTGTCFGTAATMGTICMTMGVAMGINPIYIGGAVLSGGYVGDRCSPVSTSALLVAELTKTDIYDNIKGMIKSALVPFILTVIFYFVIGLLTTGDAVVNTKLIETFGSEFKLGLIPLIPAAIVLILALCKVNVKISLTASIIAAAIIAFFYQGLNIGEIFNYALCGYTAKIEVLSPLIDGGGVTSMLKVFCIVCISSCYSGVFKVTGLLTPIQDIIVKYSKKISVFTILIPVSILISMIACNQTLAIMLVNQVCDPVESDKKLFAQYLENSVVVLAALIPWSIAGNVPLASCGGPDTSRIFAFFLYITPIWSMFYFRKKKLQNN